MFDYQDRFYNFIDEQIEKIEKIIPHNYITIIHRDFHCNINWCRITKRVHSNNFGLLRKIFKKVRFHLGAH